LKENYVDLKLLFHLGRLNAPAFVS